MPMENDANLPRGILEMLLRLMRYLRVKGSEQEIRKRERSI